MRVAVTRILVVLVLLVGFALVWMAIAFEWSALQWVLPLAYGVLLIGVTFALFRRLRRRRVPVDSPPTASDEYSDIALGRLRPTFPVSDTAASSQVGDPPERGDADVRLPDAKQEPR